MLQCICNRTDYELTFLSHTSSFFLLYKKNITSTIQIIAEKRVHNQAIMQTVSFICVWQYFECQCHHLLTSEFFLCTEILNVTDWWNTQRPTIIIMMRDTIRNNMLPLCMINSFHSYDTRRAFQQRSIYNDFDLKKKSQWSINLINNISIVWIAVFNQKMATIRLIFNCDCMTA